MPLPPPPPLKKIWDVSPIPRYCLAHLLHKATQIATNLHLTFNSTVLSFFCPSEIVKKKKKKKHKNAPPVKMYRFGLLTANCDTNSKFV